MMLENMRYMIRIIALVLFAVVLTQTVFFIVYSYLMCGDAFLALRNFYYLTYGWRI